MERLRSRVLPRAAARLFVLHDVPRVGENHVAGHVRSFIVLYVTSGAVAPGVGYFSGNLLPAIADGNWHELSATLSGNKAAIQRIGFQVYPSTTMPTAAVVPARRYLLDNAGWSEAHDAAVERC